MKSTKTNKVEMSLVNNEGRPLPLVCEALQALTGPEMLTNPFFRRAQRQSKAGRVQAVLDGFANIGDRFTDGIMSGIMSLGDRALGLRSPSVETYRAVEAANNEFFKGFVAGMDQSQRDALDAHAMAIHEFRQNLLRDSSE